MNIMRVLCKIVSCGMALLVGIAANAGPVTRDTFKQDEYKSNWVALELTDDGLRVCSGPAVLVKTETGYLMYTDVVQFCLFPKDEGGTLKLIQTEGITLRNKEVEGMGNPSGTNPQLLPRPFAVDATKDHFTLSFMDGNTESDLHFTVILYKNALSANPSLPPFRLEYARNEKEDETETVVFSNQDTVVLSLENAYLKRMTIPPVKGLVRLKSLVMRGKSGSLFSKSFPENGILEKEEAVDIGKNLSGDVTLSVNYSFPKLGEDATYSWQDDVRTFVLTVSNPDPIDVLPLLVKIMAALMLLLSCFLAWHLWQRRRGFSGDDNLFRREMDERTRIIDEQGMAIEDQKEKIKELTRKAKTVEEALKHSEGQVTKYESDLNALARTHAAELGNLRQAHAGELQTLERTHAAELDDLKKAHAGELQTLTQAHANEVDALNKENDSMKRSLQTDLAFYRSLQSARIGQMRRAVNALSEILKASNNSNWEKIARNLEFSFARMDERIHLILNSHSPVDDASFVGLQTALRTEVIPYLKDGKSWATIAAQFYAYSQNKQVRDMMTSMVLDQQYVADLYYGMRDFYAGCGVTLDALPRLFIDVPNDNQEIGCIDLLISYLFGRQYESLVSGSAIIDILLLGYSLPDGQSEKTVVAIHSTPQA